MEFVQSQLISSIDGFCRGYVNPYMSILKKIGAFAGIMQLLKILDKEGIGSYIAGCSLFIKPRVEILDAFRAHGMC